MADFRSPRRVWRPRPTYKYPKWANLRVEVFRRDGFSCVECGWAPEHVPDDYDGRYTISESRPDRQLEMDHIVSLASGGGNSPENFQTLCNRCNMAKGPH